MRNLIVSKYTNDYSIKEDDYIKIELRTQIIRL